MKLLRSLPKLIVALATGSLLAALPLSAHDGHEPDPTSTPAPAGTLVPVSAKTDATWLAKARAAYALDRCPVCGDKLDDKSPEYIYQQAGKPDRLVRFCGDAECVPAFSKEPEKYLRMIDDAAAKAHVGTGHP
jgi:YHS domain-containing protein